MGRNNAPDFHAALDHAGHSKKGCGAFGLSERKTEQNARIEHDKALAA
jgi:hypothetical protein